MRSKPSSLCFALIIALLQFCQGAYSQDKNWTHFRGSSLSGLAENEKIPLVWDEPVIKWKTPIHDRGHSSPVVYGDQVWITTATPEGTELYALCIDFNTGKIIHDIKVFAPEKAGRKHALNTYATPTPCIEKGYVYVHYGSLGTACISTSNGRIVWKNTEFTCNHVQGAASSPVIYRNLLILHFEGTDSRFIVALDKSTGKAVWRTDRPEEPYRPLAEIGRKAYITPLIMNVRGRDMMISNSSAVCIAYDPASGKEIWRVVNGAESTISMPFAENGVAYWYAGPVMSREAPTYNELMAVNPDGSGDITAKNVIWKKQFRQSQNQMLTPVIRDGLIYTVNTTNTMTCLNAADGSEVWTERVRSNFNASPLYIDGNIWFFSVKGEVMVVKAAKSFETVAVNQLDAGIWATPAVVRNSMIVRTENTLYRISY